MNDLSVISDLRLCLPVVVFRNQLDDEHIVTDAQFQYHFVELNIFMSYEFTNEFTTFPSTLNF